jgi:hypothetical protein
LKIVSVQVFLTGVTDENIEKVHKIVNEDWRSTILEIAGSLSFSCGTY